MKEKTGGNMDIGKIIEYVFMGFIGLVGLFLLLKLLVGIADGNSKKADEAQRKEEVFERIMREGTYEQKMIAMQYKQMKQLEALKGLVLFDIFFR
jgi:hypothetical protein